MGRDLKIRPAHPTDLERVCKFVDYWLARIPKKDQPEGVKGDYFVPKRRQDDYIKNYQVLIAIDPNHIVGWAVKDPKNVLIHLLVSGDARGQGIGTQLLKALNPEIVRSKTDQTTGDPIDFYLKHDYVPTGDPLQGKHQNIQILEKKAPESHPGRTIDRLSFLKPKPTSATG